MLDVVGQGWIHGGGGHGGQNLSTHLLVTPTILERELNVACARIHCVLVFNIYTAVSPKRPLSEVL